VGVRQWLRRRPPETPPDLLALREVPEGDRARELWRELPAGVRQDVIRRARRGVAAPEPGIACLAVGWAWAVVGPPHARRTVSTGARVRAVAEKVFEAAAGAGAVYGAGSPFEGYEPDDALPPVRRVAFAVEAANVPPLRAAGILPPP
jgi:hypothetical protein